MSAFKRGDRVRSRDFRWPQMAGRVVEVFQIGGLTHATVEFDTPRVGSIPETGLLVMISASKLTHIPGD